MAVGLVVFFVLAAGCKVLYNQTENRLLKQRSREAGATLQFGVNNIRLPAGCRCQACCGDRR